MENLKDTHCHQLPAEKRRGTPAWLKFLRQFNQPLVYILLVASGVTAFLEE